MVGLLEDSNLAAIHAKRVTIVPKDVQVRRLCDNVHYGMITSTNSEPPCSLLAASAGSALNISLTMSGIIYHCLQCLLRFA